jgi:hypothetical protein
MPVVPLLDATGDATENVCRRPAAGMSRFNKPKSFPGSTVARVLEHAAVHTHCAERRLEATVVLAEAISNRSSRAARPEAAPAFTRRVRHDTMRACVQPGIA